MLQNIGSESFKDIQKIKEHEIIIYNVTLGMDITEVVKTETIQIDRNKTGNFGIISTDIAQFKLELPRKEPYNKSISDYISRNDKIQIKNVFEGYEFVIFTGYVPEMPVENWENLKHSSTVKVHDRIKYGLKAKFQDDIIKLGWKVCDNANTSQSIAHYLAYQMGLTGSDIDFEDIGITIPYVHFEKGNRIMDEFAELVKSVRGTAYMAPNDVLIFNTPFNQDDYNDINFTFDTNINKKINVSESKTESDKVTLFYDVFNILNRQICWQFFNEKTYDKRNDEANMLLQAGVTSSWIKINWVTPIVVDNESSSPEVVVEDRYENDMSAYFSWEMNAKNNGGKVRFQNQHPEKDIFIQKFKIYGKPLEKRSDNEYNYTGKSSPDNEYEIEKNKFIQSKTHADKVVKYTHFHKCQNFEEIEFHSIYAPFIQINDLVSVNKRSKNGQYTIDKITHSSKNGYLETNIKLTGYKPYPTSFSGIIETIDQASNFTEITIESNEVEPPKETIWEKIFWGKDYIELMWKPNPPEGYDEYEIRLDDNFGENY